MKNSYFFLVIVLILLGIGIGIYFFNKNNNSNSDKNNYNSEKLSTTENSNQSQDSNSSNAVSNSENANNEENSSTNTSPNSNSENTTNGENQTQENPKTETETQIADFTTKIYTKEEDRQNNISITCSSLNDTTVDPGKTFSFCNTVGKATSAKGYEKADVFKDGEKVQALGGGNCQVSTTLYNAVLKVPGLDVTERHEHSNSVPYIGKGKDAAVSYGTYDLKFVNNTGNKIKITASCDKDFVYCKIFKIE